MKNIILVGFMGSGKTAVGKVVAERLGYQFIDTDEIIEKERGKSISAIFSEEGESGFRELEARLVAELSGIADHVISTGGGIFTIRENISNLRSSGVVIWLRASPETIYKRVVSEPHRPLLNVGDPLMKIKELMAVREPFYAEADICIDTDRLGVNKIADMIITVYDKAKCKHTIQT